MPIAALLNRPGTFWKRFMQKFGLGGAAGVLWWLRLAMVECGTGALPCFLRPASDGYSGSTSSRPMYLHSMSSFVPCDCGKGGREW